MRRLAMAPRHLVFLLFTLAAMMPNLALAETASQVYERVKDSIVVVKAYDRTGRVVGLGSGVILPSGDIVTNWHVLEKGERYTVARGTQASSATVKVFESEKDLCLLKASGRLGTPASLGQTTKLKVGEPVFSVGAPQGLELSLSEGIVSQLRGGPPPIIQTTVAISPGSSGGGLFNTKGELVGITTFYLKEGQSLNFALPVEWIIEIVEVARRKPGRELTDEEAAKLGLPVYQGPKPETMAKNKKPGAPETGSKGKGVWTDKAIALEKAGDYQGLVTHCRQWTQAEPGNDIAWFSLGLAYGQLGRHREAIEAYHGALRVNPDFASAWHNLGVDYRDLGLHREAIEAYREALRLKPNDADYWLNLGVSYGTMGHPREAISAYREALRLKPNYALAWYNLGCAYAQSGNRSAALEAVKELRRYDPQLADKLFNLVLQP